MEANRDAATAPHAVHGPAIQRARELGLASWLVRAATASASSVARELATTVEATGGARVVEDNGARVLSPVAAPDWHDLGTLYLAVTASGETSVAADAAWRAAYGVLGWPVAS